MSATDDIGNAGEGIGSAISDAAAAAKKSKDNLRKLKQSYTDLKKVLSSTGSTLLDSRQEFSKYSKVVDYTNLAVSQAAKNYKTGKTQGAIILFSNMVSGVVKSLLEYNDNQLAIYDRLSKLGYSATYGAKNIQNLINQTSFWYTRFDGFMNSVDKLGTGLLTLGKTTGEGINELSKVLRTEDVEGVYIRMGYTIESLASVQTDYIKLQELSGIKITQDAATLQRESLEYAASLKLLSAITGEDVEKLSQKMAEQSLDFKFQLKMTEVDKKTRDRLTKAAVIAGTMFGPETEASVRDFLANGFASLKKSEGLMVVTKGQITTWANQLEEGTITELEFNRKIGMSIREFEKTNRTALGFSEVYQQEMGINTRSVEGGYKIMNIQTDEQLNALMDSIKATEDQDGTLKGLQIAQVKAERKTARVTSSVLNVVSGPLNTAFLSLMHLVKQVALLSAKLGNFLLGKQTEAFENVIKILGSPEDIKALNTKIDSSLVEINDSIKNQADAGKETKAAKDKLDKIREQQKALIQQGKTVTPEQKAEETAAMVQYEKAKQAEKSRYGKTTEELELKKSELERRKAGIASSVIRREEEEKAEAATINKERVEKVIQFSGGVTGDYTHFSQVNPALAEKVIGLAEKYFQMTGKKLTVNSGYRSAEEQTDMYNAWVAAGGNDTDKKTVHTEKYGNLYMPGKTSRHTARGAVDIDEDQLKQLGDQLINSFGLKRPYPDKDPVHIEGAKKGGIFDGPSSGYPMLFHGPEAIVPLLDNKTMAINLKNADPATAFDMIRNSMEKIIDENETTSMPRRKSNESAVTALIDHIDTMISQVSQSNSIYHDIKLYMST